MVFKRVTIVLIVFFILPLNLFTLEKKQVDELLKFNIKIKKIIKEWKIPGMVIGIIYKNKIVFKESYGLRDVKNRLPVNEHSRFNIASITKSYTAMSIALLREEGKLNYDDPVIKHLPEFRLKDSYTTEHTTIRDLLAHRTNFGGHYLLDKLFSKNRWELFNRFQYLDCVGTFRKEHNYNNHMYMVAGCIVEKISGKTWENFTKENIFNPLGLSDSCFDLEITNNNNYCFPYYYDNDEYKPYPFRDRIATNTSGGINASLSDMLRWMSYQMNSKVYKFPKIIKSASKKEMHSPSSIIDYNSKSTFGAIELYGLGWNLRPFRGNMVIHHGGVNEGYMSWLSFMPDKQIGIIIMQNTSDNLLPFFIPYMVYEIMLDDQKVKWDKSLNKYKPDYEIKETKKKKKEIKPPFDVQILCGTYTHKGYGSLQIVKTKNSFKAIFNKKIETILNYRELGTFITKSKDNDFTGLSLTFTLNSKEKTGLIRMEIPYTKFVIKFKKQQ